MYHFLYDGPIQSFQLKVGPINCGLGLGDGFEILFPWRFLGIEFMVHHEDAKYIELCIFGCLVIEQIIVLLE